MQTDPLLFKFETADISKLPELTALRKQYPYCSFIHVLEAIHASKADKGLYMEMVRKAAVFSYSRVHLRQLLKKCRNGVFKPEPIDHTFYPESSLSDSSFSENHVHDNLQLSVSFVDEVDVGKANLIPEEFESQVPEIPVSDSSSDKRVEETVKDDQAGVQENKIVEPVLNARSEVPTYVQLDLIDKFIELEPRIKPRKEQAESGLNKDLSAGVGEWDNEIISETLAIVLLKQKKYMKAIEMYDKLKLKFPEKTTYFAALI